MRRPRPSTGVSLLLRPIRLLILLLAVALTLVLALLRPLQGRATHVAHMPRAHHAKAHHPRHVRPQTHHRPHLRHALKPHPFGSRVVAYARHFLGVRYNWGGSSPRTGFDCSGLVRYVYGHFGIALPHSSYGDLVRGHRVSRRWLRPGDLVFFAGASHVGIYAGGGRVIDAPHSGAVVQITTMRSSWYGSSFYGARRLGVG
jgi:cell wall-associated NlpC family hydrolase